MWDVSAGKELRKISAASEQPSAIALNSDGKTLAVQDKDATIRLYEVFTGKEVARFRNNKKGELYPLGMAFSPDGKKLAAVEEHRPDWHSESTLELTVWETAAGKIIYRRPGKKDYLTSREFENIQFSPDGGWLAWIGGQEEVVLVDSATGKKGRRLRCGDSLSVDNFAFAEDGKTLIAKEQPFREEFFVWDVETGKMLRSFKWSSFEAIDSFLGQPITVAVSPDGKRLALAGLTGPIPILDVAKGAELHRFDAPRQAIIRLSFTRDGKEVLTTEEGHRHFGQNAAPPGERILDTDEAWSVRAWEASTGKPLRTISTDAHVYQYVPAWGGVLMLNGSEIWFLKLGKHQFLPVLFAHPSGSQYSVSMNNPARELLPVLSTHPHMLGGKPYAISADNKLLAIAGTKAEKGVIGVFELTIAKEIGPGKLRCQFALPNHLPGPKKDIEAGLPRFLLFSADAGTLAAQFQDGKVTLWSLATGRELPTIQPHKNNEMRALGISTDGRSLVVDAGDNMPRLFETATGRERRLFALNAKETRERSSKNGERNKFAHLLRVETAIGILMLPNVAISPNGRILAHCGPRGTITLWNVATGKELAELRGHQADVMTLAFSPDGKTLASGSRDTTALIWDVSRFTAKAKPQAAAVDAPARWQDLMSDDAVKAFDAICALAAAPDKAVPYLNEHARPAIAADAAAINRLIADLDSDQFDMRKKANEELAKLGEAAVPFVRKALEANPSPEARKRLQALLAKEPWRVPTGETLSSLRAIEVLEMIGTVEAKSVLKNLARGKAEALVTRAALAALERLGR
jgi:WD40 repeat protein